MGCIICKKSEEKIIFKNLIQCKNCDLIYYNKIDGIDINNLYDESYFNGEEYFDYKDDKIIIQKNFLGRLKEIRKYIDGGNLFEIGCAYGFFLDLAKIFFNVSGMDITKKPTDYARNELKLKVFTESYIDYPFYNNFDVVCMWDTIEHLESPEKFVSKISSELRLDGYLFLTTGDIGSLLAKIKGSSWRMIHPPTHLFYFSQKTITKLLKNYGFEVVDIKYPGIYRSLKQIIFSLFFLKSKKIPKIFEIILNRFNFPIYINTHDIMMVVAKKI